MMAKIFFLSLFQACFLVAAPVVTAEPDSNPTSPIFPQVTDDQIANVLREAMRMPRETEIQVMSWRDKIHEIADRSQSEITMIKSNGEGLVFRQGNLRLIRLLPFDSPDFRIEFHN